MIITVQEMYELVKDLAQAEEARFLELKDRARKLLERIEEYKGAE